MPATTQHITYLLIITLIFGAATIVLAYMARWQAVLVALATMVTAQASGYCPLSTYTLLFWSAATAVVLVICRLLPEQVRDSSRGMAYYCTGALMGAVVGMMFNTSAGIILATAVAVALSAAAWGRTPAGKELGYPSRQYFNYVCAKGLPLVVIFSMLGIIAAILTGGTR